MSRDLKLFIRYITPSMAGMLIAGLYSIVDTFFIGKAVGAVGLAAAALTWPVVMLSGAGGDDRHRCGDSAVAGAGRREPCDGEPGVLLHDSG